MYTGCTKHLPAWPWTWPGGRPPTLAASRHLPATEPKTPAHTPRCSSTLSCPQAHLSPVAFPTDAPPGACSCLGFTTAFRCPFLGTHPAWDVAPTWVLLLLTTRSSNTTENERPPYVRHHKRFTGCTAAVIYSAVSRVRLQSSSTKGASQSPGGTLRASSASWSKTAFLAASYTYTFGN